MRKLLRYDMQSFSKLWWIATIAVGGFFAIATVCMRGLMWLDSYEITVSMPAWEVPLRIVCILGLIISLFASTAYFVLVIVFIIRRFYTHLYTDQGYLTFTLPVKRSQIFGAKLAMGWIYYTAAQLVFAVGFFLFLLIGTAEHGFINADIFTGIGNIFSSLWESLGWRSIVLGFELLVLLCVSNAMTLLFFYTCITMASVLVKRMKLLLGIGIYYGLTNIFTFILQIFFILIINTDILMYISMLEETQTKNVVLLLVALVTLVVMTVSWVLFRFNVHLMRKKLNLA
ncbi:MAG: hypothetical protein IJF42_05400 [Clostridia bacterium]|nr:hypothetical protein [Clostridia bacterium]